MKIRTFLLFICMVVVPLLAMFSHKIPTEIRAACGELVLQPAIDLIETVARSADTEPASPAVDLEAPPAAPFLAGTPQPQGQAPLASAQGGNGPGPATAASTALAPAAGIAEASPMPAAMPPQAAPPSTWPQQTLASTSGVPVGPERASTQPLRGALAAAGVQRLTIQPAADGSGRLHGSCRLAVDARGELQRLFHTQALSETETLQNLLDQVSRWQQRLAARPTGTATTAQRIR